MKPATNSNTKPAPRVATPDRADTGGSVTQDRSGPGQETRRPNTAPTYYLGRPASLWVTAMRQRRRRAGSHHLMQDPGSALSHRRMRLALPLIATAQLMVILDATIVNVALPHIRHALGFSGSGLQWVVNAFSVTFAGLLLLGGRAGDILGRRKVFIAGAVLFSAASLARGFATRQAWLLAARAAQGAAGAILAPAALSLVTTTFPEGRLRNRAMGVYAATSIAGGAAGLIAGAC